MAEKQLWFFLREQMTIAQFTQAVLSLDDVRKTDITLEYCLKATGTTGTVDDYAFYIHSASMAAAVRLLTDGSIIATYNLYCRRDPVVTITIRKATDPSPNTSLSASHQNSQAERRKISAQRGLLVPELFIQPRVPHVSGCSDISTGEAISDEDNMVTLRVGEEFATFTKEYLLGWIGAQLADLRSLTDIRVQYCTSDGMMGEVQLTDEVWQHSLLRGQWKSTFAPVWDDYIRLQCERKTMLEKMTTEFPEFHQKCQNFVHDLRTFGANKGAQARLEQTRHEFYIGGSYCNDSMRSQLLSLPVSKAGTLGNVLRNLAMKRQDSTICASHDMAPIFEFALGVKWDKSSAKAAVSARRTVVARSRSLRVPAASKSVSTAPTALAATTTGTGSNSAQVPCSTSNIALFLTNLRLLELDLEPDWPDITLTTFSAKDAAGGQKKRIQCVEWALYQLFTLWDQDEAQNKLRPFFPPLDQVQSINLRAALLRGLEQAKKNGILGRDAVVRKTMLDECKGERLEEVLAVFSSAVLKKLVAERALNGGPEYRPTISEKISLENWGYTGDRTVLNALLLAHKVSLSCLLAKKGTARQRYKEFEELLSSKERGIIQRKEQSNTPNEVEHQIDASTKERVGRTLRRNWTGNDRWIDSLLFNDTNPPKGGFLGTDFDEIWAGVENGQVSDIESRNAGLLEQLDERVRLQKARLEKWNGFREKMFGNSPSGPPQQKEDESKPKTRGIEFNAHQNLAVDPKETEEISKRVASVPGEYAKILGDMKSEFDRITKAKIPNFSSLLKASKPEHGLGGFQRLSMPKNTEEPISDLSDWEDQAEKPAPEKSGPEKPLPPPKPARLSGGRDRRNSQDEPNPAPNTRQVPRLRRTEARAALNGKTAPDHPDPAPPRREVSQTARLPEGREPGNTRLQPPASRAASGEMSPMPLDSPPSDKIRQTGTATPPPPSEPSPRRLVSPTQALADEILASMSNASPTPGKKKQRHTLSLAERTRMSMTRATSFGHEDDNDDDAALDPFSPSPSRRKGGGGTRPHSRSEPQPPSTPAATIGPDGDEYEDLMTRTQRSMAGFEAARQRAQLERRRSQRRSRMSPRKESGGSSVGDASIVEELLGDAGRSVTDLDMETVFMSRPKIKASPPGSPIKGWGDM
ncbi:hypothetical protein DL771_005460 [Monosporascus sp. 5C6A]|nr:hypothetical protein DL771_005460 [Monosporascus sp. 5C6A]